MPACENPLGIRILAVWSQKIDKKGVFLLLTHLAYVNKDNDKNPKISTESRIFWLIYVFEQKNNFVLFGGCIWHKLQNV